MSDDLHTNCYLQIVKRNFQNPLKARAWSWMWTLTIPLAMLSACGSLGLMIRTRDAQKCPFLSPTALLLRMPTDDDDDRFYSLQEVSQTYETRVSYKDTSTKSIQNVQN